MRRQFGVKIQFGMHYEHSLFQNILYSEVLFWRNKVKILNHLKYINIPFFLKCQLYSICVFKTISLKVVITTFKQIKKTIWFNKIEKFDEDKTLIVKLHEQTFRK